MGTDNLFHKRKARKAESLRRKGARKSSYDVVLIVCEGGKTEPAYFTELIKDLRLNSANVRISGQGADPLSVVDFAIAEFRKELKKEQKFDRVYCVFDRDRHTTYHAAMDKVKHTRLGRGGKILAVPSIPCFEFWLLLHFIYTTRPFNAPAGDSICFKVGKELEKHLPGYRKGDRNVFAKLRGKLDNAIANARRLEQFHQTSGTDNPSTRVYCLVEYLLNLKKQNT
ncbi:MAG: RloB domain-containing protein [Deltaproteobacteria bacterium]|nr:RloB domain-containing protein [Deltaproteobacteria bacterium]